MSSIILLKFSSNCPDCANGSKYYLTMEEIKMFNTKEELYYYLYEQLEIEDVIDIDLELTEKYNNFIEERFNSGFMTPNIEVESDCLDCGYAYLYGDYSKIGPIDLSEGGYFANIREIFPVEKSDESSSWPQPAWSRTGERVCSERTSDDLASNESFRLLSGSDDSSDDSSIHDS